MATKAWEAKVICTNEEKAHLWRTHKIFNKNLPFVIQQMFKMKRGEAGDDKESGQAYKIIFESIGGSQNSIAKMEAVTSLKFKSGKDEDWAKLAKKLTKKKKILFDRFEELPGFSSEFRRKLFEMSFQLISGHEELKKLWEKEHEEWAKEKLKFEESNPNYMRARPILEEFEKEVGTGFTKRRMRWHKYLDFLKSHPELAAWRGEEAVVNPIPAEGQQRIKRAYRSKKMKMEGEEFFKANPELEALDRVHSKYEIEFVRRRAIRKNPDGFRHRPTFTLPSPEKHPAWFSFKKDSTYKNLDTDKCEIQLKVITSDKEEERSPKGYTVFRFKPDKRLKGLKKFRRIHTTHKKTEKEKTFYSFFDKNLQIDREVDIKGVKLIFRPAKPTGTPYLVFTCNIKNKELTPRAKEIKWVESDEKTQKGKYKFPSDLITCAVDLGIRNLGVATIMQMHNGKLPDKPVAVNFISLDEVGLRHIKKHKKEIGKLRSERGQAAKGERSFISLQDHITDMGEDRFKKGAREIVNFAVKHNADVIILERMAGLIPDAEKQKGINRALMEWNRRNLTEWVKMLGKEAGIKVFTVSPHHSSWVCSRCGSLGRRYSVCKDKKTGQVEKRFETVGKLFACPEENCLLEVNADYNASINLHKIFNGNFVRPEKIGKGIYRHRNNEVKFSDIEERIRNRLENLIPNQLEDEIVLQPDELDSLMSPNFMKKR
ncbi:MAG: zinc ribbon domain-containing protein [Chloroflexi bacterium]|nr:zinc ribbon domain-containing protein [Chloroflexota bacterium]